MAIDKKIKKTLGIAIVLILVMGFYIEQGSTMPDNAILVVDPQNKTYYSPTYISEDVARKMGFVQMRRNEIIGKGYSPDDDCRNSGCFSSDDYAPLIWYQIKKVLGLNKKRWNSDGTWNW
jgi:hypothetical protein